MKNATIWICIIMVFLVGGLHRARAAELEMLKFNNPGLTVDLGVGLWAWPLPMDYDNDGDMDLVVSCPDKPYNGTYFFENKEGNVPMPVFEPAVRIGDGFSNVSVSTDGTGYRVVAPFTQYRDFTNAGFSTPEDLPVSMDMHRVLYGFGRRIRAKQWSYVDYNGDAKTDIVVGMGDWTDYGWDDAYDENGNWTNGPLRGAVFVLPNKGSDSNPKYGKPKRLGAGGAPLETYGMPSPNFADFDGDGDLDIICGEFLDRLTWFENTGTRTKPEYAEGRFLESGGEVITMDLEMIVPVAVDWTGDGRADLIVGQEDGRVALLENTGEVKDGMPVFTPPRFFRQRADAVKFGALATPYSIDWDADGDEDIIAGNTAGYIGFIENLGGGAAPVWAEPVYLEAGGGVIRIQAGENGSIQGPAEAKWGYTTVNVADWDHDGLPDIIANSIWGRVVWYRNVGTKESPALEKESPIEVRWQGPTPKPEWNWWNPEGNEFVTQWRTTPVVLDFTGDGLNDLVMLDHEGYLSLFERQRADADGGRFILLPPVRIFVGEEMKPLQLNTGRAGHSGRRKIDLVDWNGDGLLDILVNTINAELWTCTGVSDGKYIFRNDGNFSDQILAGHSTSPTTVDWNKDGTPDLLVGAEDGHFYFMENSSKK